MAAVDLDDYLPFASGIGASRDEASIRKLFRLLNSGGRSGVVEGELNGFEAYGPGSGTMAVKVKSGRCVLEGHYGESTSEKTVTLTNPHATLLRPDLVILRADFTAKKIQLDFLTGTPGGAVAAVTQNSVMYEQAIAQVNVAAGSPYALPTGDVVDMRRFTQERGPSVQAKRITDFPITTSTTVYTPVNFTAENWDTDGMHDSSSNADRITCVKAGRYPFKINAEIEENATGTRGLRLLKNGSDTNWETGPIDGFSLYPTRLNLSGEIELAVGDYLQAAVRQDSGSTLQVQIALFTVSYGNPIVRRTA